MPQAFRTTDGDAIDRAHVVRVLARASHDSWMQQRTRDKGDPEPSPTVTEHDLERAEDAVRALEEIGLLHAVD
jgi:hypothetical protein